MPGTRLTVTLPEGQRKKLDEMVEAINKNRPEPVTISQIVRLAVSRMLEENRKNSVELAQQIELPF